MDMHFMLHIVLGSFLILLLLRVQSKLSVTDFSIAI
jgi:hypothetical protein